MKFTESASEQKNHAASSSLPASRQVKLYSFTCLTAGNELLVA